MQPTIRLRASLNGDVTEVQTLIKHPMNSGFTKDETDTIIPPHYIERVSVEHDGNIVFVADWGPMIAKDPYLRFSFKGGKIGDIVKLTYTDSKESGSVATAVIEPVS
jgi:sulfur-oxidizing protein SoxZ